MMIHPATMITSTGETLTWEPCPRCGGNPETWAGTLDNRHCWQCDNNPDFGKWLDQKTIDRRAKNRARYAAKKQKEHLARIAAEQAAFDMWAAAHTDVIAMVKRLDQATGQRLHTLGFEATLAMERRKPLSDSMIKAVEAAIIELDAPTAPVVEGKTVVTGTVLGFKNVQTFHSYHETFTLKMIVRDERGFKVYGTVPAGLEADKGDTIRFTATLARSNDDETFGWLKHPTKATILARATTDDDQVGVAA